MSALLNRCVTCSDGSGVLIALLGKPFTAMTTVTQVHYYNYFYFIHCFQSCFSCASIPWLDATVNKFSKLATSMLILHSGRSYN